MYKRQLRYALQKELEITQDLRNHADKTKIKIAELTHRNDFYRQKCIEHERLEEWISTNHLDILTTYRVINRLEHNEGTK